MCYVFKRVQFDKQLACVCVCLSLHCGRVDVFPYTCFEGLGCLLLLCFLQGDVALLPLLLLLLKLLFSLSCNLENKNHMNPTAATHLWRMLRLHTHFRSTPVSNYGADTSMDRGVNASYAGEIDFGNIPSELYFLLTWVMFQFNVLCAETPHDSKL